MQPVVADKATPDSHFAARLECRLRRTTQKGSQFTTISRPELSTQGNKHAVFTAPNEYAVNRTLSCNIATSNLTFTTTKFSLDYVLNSGGLGRMVHCRRACLLVGDSGATVPRPRKALKFLATRFSHYYALCILNLLCIPSHGRSQHNLTVHTVVDCDCVAVVQDVYCGISTILYNKLLSINGTR